MYSDGSGRDWNGKAEFERAVEIAREESLNFIADADNEMIGDLLIDPSNYDNWAYISDLGTVGDEFRQEVKAEAKRRNLP